MKYSSNLSMTDNSRVAKTRTSTVVTTSQGELGLVGIFLWLLAIGGIVGGSVYLFVLFSGDTSIAEAMCQYSVNVQVCLASIH